MPDTDTSEKLFAIGDIHGCYRQLATLLDRLPGNPETDTLVFLGDYINRGPDSKKVLDRLIRVRDEWHKTIFLLGNHEEMLIEYAVSGDLDRLHYLRGMGVDSTLNSYGATMQSVRDLAFMPTDHQEFMMSLMLSWTWGDYLFAHADADIIDAEENGTRMRCVDQLVASRRLLREVPLQCGKIMVFGHTPLEMPLVMPDRIGIDTGAVYGNMLTAVELPAKRFYHAR